jgi:hypothetical protein
MDPMGLGGVGGGFFGGDVDGSGGSTLTGLGIKDGVETTPKQEQEKESVEKYLLRHLLQHL